MRNAKKPEHILEMEKDTPSPLQEILMPSAIVERSKTQLALRGSETVDEMIPEISIIARENNLNNRNERSRQKNTKRISRRPR